MRDTDDSAFPRIGVTPGAPHDEVGLTKREYFAALAMRALVAKGYLTDSPSKFYQPTLESRAIQIADALLRELAK